MTEPAATTVSDAHQIRCAADLGRVRRLDRCATADGFLAVAAIDHPASLLAPRGLPPLDPARAAEFKVSLIRELAQHASGLLLDPDLSIGQATLTAALPGAVGMIANIEQMRETPAGFALEVDLRPGWTPDRIAEAGADGVKFVFFDRSERPEAIEADVARVTELVDRCHAVGLPLVIEPLWYPRDGEDARDPTVARERARAIVAAAARFAECGADVLKVQFPGNVSDATARSAAATAAAELDAVIDVPWVLLSEGVGFDEFAVQLELAAAAGASGFMAGRAVWADVVTATGDRRAAIVTAGERVGALTASLRASGRPWRERVSQPDAEGGLAHRWWAAGPGAAPR